MYSSNVTPAASTSVVTQVTQITQATPSYSGYSKLLRLLQVTQVTPSYLKEVCWNSHVVLPQHLVLDVKLPVLLLPGQETLCHSQ